jgi:flagellar L-ring protein precursor FlgH
MKISIPNQKTIQWMSLGLVIASLVSCAGVTPTTITNGPSTSKPVPEIVYKNNTGGIYQERTFRPLFEDKRARYVGDTITIIMTETTSANKKNNATLNSTGSVAIKTTNYPGEGSTNDLANLSPQGGGTRKLTAEDSGIAQNAFNTTLAATVNEVLPNGNLVVSGEKQIGFDKSTEFIRFSGVISPAFISVGNTVASTQVADVRVEYRTNTNVDKSVIANMINRFFFSMFPL